MHDELAQELFEANRFNASLLVERQALADQLATLEARVQAVAHRDISAAREDRDRAHAERDAAIRARDAAQAALAESQAQLARILGSTAWRLTAPLRHGLMLLLRRPRA